MSTVTFASMVPDISAFLPGCPSLTIERTAKKLISDLCTRAKVWTVDMLPIAVTDGGYSYSVSSPVAYGEFVEYVSGYFINSSGIKTTVAWNPINAVEAAYPSWPQEGEGTPILATFSPVRTLLLAPVPDAAGTLYIRGTLRPTDAATTWDGEIYKSCQRVVFHGVLHELMAMPERPWTNVAQAGAHGKQWTYLLNQGRARADRGYNSGSLAVAMRPLA